MNPDPYSSDYHEDQAREARRDRGEPPEGLIPRMLAPRPHDPEDERRKAAAAALVKSWTQQPKPGSSTAATKDSNQ